MKIMPSEPTAEMIKAVQREVMCQLDAGLSCQGDIFAKELCEAVINATPTVDGEPVAWALATKNGELLFHYDGYVQQNKECVENLSRGHLGTPEVLPLYTFPPDAAAKIAQTEAELKKWKKHADDIEKDNEHYIAENEKIEADRSELVEALSNLSFECYDLIRTKAPSTETYNKSFALLTKMERK